MIFSKVFCIGLMLRCRVPVHVWLGILRAGTSCFLATIDFAGLSAISVPLVAPWISNGTMSKISDSVRGTEFFGLVSSPPLVLWSGWEHSPQSLLRQNSHWFLEYRLSKKWRMTFGFCPSGEEDLLWNYCWFLKMEK